MPILAITHRPEHRLGRYAKVVYFTWAAVVDATTYLLKVGTSTGGTQRYNADVGNVLIFPLTLEPGTYFSNVVPYNGATPMDALVEQTVTV
jgi:large repetitive protein